MSFVEQLSAVALLVDFLLGVTLGVVGGAVHGSLLEDRGKTLLRTAPDELSAGARMIYGVYIRDDGHLERLLDGRGPMPRGAREERGSEDSSARGRDPRQ